MTPRRIGAIVAAVAAVVLVVVLVGASERSRHSDRENAGIADVVGAVGPLDSPSLKGFRLLTRFQCLVYTRGGVEFALELCVDRDGRVVEAIDRRSGEPEFWSLREDPSRADVRVDRTEVERLIVKMCPDCAGIFERNRAES